MRRWKHLSALTGRTGRNADAALVERARRQIGLFMASDRFRRDHCAIIYTLTMDKVRRSPP